MEVDTVNEEHHGDGSFLSGGRRRRVSSDLTGERFYHQIEVGVRTGGGKESLWQSLGGGEALTRANRAGDPKRIGRPELGKKTLPGSSDGLGGVLW